MEKPVQLQPHSRPEAPSPAAPPPQSRLSILFAAPHRSMFLAGAVQALLAFAPWAWELLARTGLFAGPAWPWPPACVTPIW